MNYYQLSEKEPTPSHIGLWLRLNLIAEESLLNSLKDGSRHFLSEFPLFSYLKGLNDEYGIRTLLVVDRYSGSPEALGFSSELCDDIRRSNAWLSLIAADKAPATAPATKDGDFVFFFEDKISDSESKALIEKVRQHFLKPYRRMAEIVFRSDSPDEKPSFLNTFTASLRALQKILYMDVSIVVNEKLLFTTCETSWLFCFDPKENSLEIIFDFSFISYGASRFVSIISYGDELWFIPGHEDEIFIFTPDRKEMELLRFPDDLSERMGTGLKFSSVLRDGEVLWLVPQELRKVVRIDMKDRIMKLYDGWPEGVTFIDRKPCAFDFNCGWLMDDKLYMTASGCSANICFDTKQGGMSTWAKKDGYPRYGNYLDGKVYISPRLSGDYIRTGIDGTGVIEDPLPGELWAGIPEDSKEHRWWYVTETTRFIIFLPSYYMFIS